MAKAKAKTKKAPEQKDPREWLKYKLGEADFAAFEKGLKQGTKDLASKKVKVAEVEGQAPCSGVCMSYCAGTFDYWAFQSGYWSAVFRYL